MHRLTKTDLRGFLDTLALPRTGSKEEQIERILDFLLDPYDSGKSRPLKSRSSSFSASQNLRHFFKTTCYPGRRKSSASKKSNTNSSGGSTKKAKLSSGEETPDDEEEEEEEEEEVVEEKADEEVEEAEEEEGEEEAEDENQYSKETTRKVNAVLKVNFTTTIIIFFGF